MDRCRDARLMLVDLVNDLNHRIDRANRLHCTFLNRRNLIADVFSRFLGLSGEFLNFGRDDRKAFTRLAGSRRLNRCVQCKEVGLLCNRVILTTCRISTPRSPSLVTILVESWAARAASRATPAATSAL